MTGVEQETVCGDGKERFRVLPHIRGKEIVDVLRGEQDGRVFLSHPLHGVADVLDGGQVGKKQIRFVNGCNGVAVGQQAMVHVAQNIKQHCIPQFAVGVQQSFHAEGQKTGIGQVGVTIEKSAFIPNAHGVKPQTDLAEQFPCEQRCFSVLRLPVFVLGEAVEVREDWVIGRAEVGEICRAPDSEILIQLGQQDADCIQLRVGEVLICPEEVPQETDMLV